MDYLRPRNAVKVWGRIAVLLYECKSPEKHWGVLIVNDGTINICCVSEREIRPRMHHCWGEDCRHSSLDSENNDTCPNCHWLICNVCGRCRFEGCVDNNITIELPPDSDVPF